MGRIGATWPRSSVLVFYRGLGCYKLIVHQNIIKILIYVETGQCEPEPHEETQDEQVKREGADAIAIESGPVDIERWHRHP
jgi:hypothetical protein